MIGKSLPQWFFLLRQLIQRDVESRYKGTFGGFLWALLQPIFMLGVYTVVFGFIFKPKWSGMQSIWDYALIIFIGKIVYIFVLDSVGRSPYLVTAHISYVKRIAFPLELLPVVSMASAFLFALISLVVWCGFCLAIRGSIPPSIGLVPVVFIPLFLTCFGCSLLLASLGVYFRDVGQIMQPVIFSLMFLSPVFYSMEMVPAKLQIIIGINPMTYAIEETRALLLGGHGMGWGIWMRDVCIGVVTVLLGYAWFRRTKSGFADVI